MAGMLLEIAVRWNVSELAKTPACWSGAQLCAHIQTRHWLNK